MKDITIGNMVFDTKYSENIINSDGFQEIRCPICDNLLCKGNFPFFAEIEFLCRKRGRKSRRGCGNLIKVRIM